MPRGNQKQPIELIIAKGKKHLTKAEIEERKETEVKVNFTDVKPPEYLTVEQKQEFIRISKILLDVGIISELDEDCLAHYLIEKLLKARKAEIKRQIELEIDKYLIYQDRALKQCRACANDLGLSISSRCKLVMPPTQEPPKENKFNKFRKIG